MKKFTRPSDAGLISSSNPTGANVLELWLNQKGFLIEWTYRSYGYSISGHRFGTSMRDIVLQIAGDVREKIERYQTADLMEIFEDSKFDFWKVELVDNFSATRMERVDPVKRTPIDMCPIVKDIIKDLHNENDSTTDTVFVCQLNDAKGNYVTSVIVNTKTVWEAEQRVQTLPEYAGLTVVNVRPVEVRIS